MTHTSPSQGKRRLMREDILPLAGYAAVRHERRQRIAEIKRERRLEVGPLAAFSFENYDTMWHQVQEMLYVEKGGDAQIEDELAAYNPLIPQGRELVATVLFEIDDPVRRAAVLSRLGGIENYVFLDVAGERIRGEADPTRENTTPDGKASSVQFIRFPCLAARSPGSRPPARRSLPVSTIPITDTWQCYPTRYAPRSQKISIELRWCSRSSRRARTARCPATPITAGLGDERHG